jgi:RNA polymerase sigma-70 factor (ECF subfamily)
VVTAPVLNFDDPTPPDWGLARSRSRPRGASANVSDEALILAVRRGDRKVGSELYARLSRVIDSTLTRILGPGQPDHDDWAQAAFEEIVRSLHQGKFHQRCSLTSWAASIACHIGLNAIRSRKMERVIFDHREPTDDPSGPGVARDLERSLLARDELRRLRSVLAQLSPGRAEAVLLHDAFGYGLGEIAALSGSTVAAVQSRLVRGRKDLAEQLALSKETPQ